MGLTARARAVFACAAAVAFLLSSCASEEAGTSQVAVRRASPTINFPSQILGLSVTTEDVAKKVSEAKRPYLDSLAVVGMRDGELLRATLQVGRFNSLARPGSQRFRQRVIGQVGSKRPVTARVEKTTVYITSGNKQNIFIWFEGKGFYVLNTHSEYLFPRTLLRRILRIEQPI